LIVLLQSSLHTEVSLLKVGLSGALSEFFLEFQISELLLSFRQVTSELNVVFLLGEIVVSLESILVLESLLEVEVTTITSLFVFLLFLA